MLSWYFDVVLNLDQFFWQYVTPANAANVHNEIGNRQAYTIYKQQQHLQQNQQQQQQEQQDQQQREQQLLLLQQYHQQQQQQPYPIQQNHYNRLRHLASFSSSSSSTSTCSISLNSTRTYPRCTSPPDVVPRLLKSSNINQTTSPTIPEEFESNGIVVENYFNEYERQEIVHHHQPKRKLNSTNLNMNSITNINLNTNSLNSVSELGLQEEDLENVVNFVIPSLEIHHSGSNNVIIHSQEQQQQQTQQINESTSNSNAITNNNSNCNNNNNNININNNSSLR